MTEQTTRSHRSAMAAAPARSIGAAFDIQTRACPDALALIDGARRLTYRELGERADRLSCELAARGVVPNGFVALLLPRGIEAIVAMLAVVKAGAAFVALDTGFPSAQLRFILQDSAPTLMIADGAVLAALSPDIVGDVPCLAFASGEDWSGRLHTAPLAPCPDPRGNDPAYAIYTSGSTGRPKGVVVPHRGVLRLLLDCDYAALGPGQVMLAIAPLNFDACIFEIFGPLLAGGCIVLLRGTPSLDAVASAIAGDGVTTMFLTSGLFHLFAQHRLEALAPLQTLITGGDVLSPTLVARAYRALNGTQLLLAYGPTENTVFTTIHQVSESDFGGAPVPIGRPVSDDHVLVIDEAGRPVADGETGQLCVSGRGVALGYLNRPELTARSFVTREDGTRAYLTGDLGWRDRNGVLHFAGRTDRQVKINGKRVELDAVELALRESGGVEDAAAVLREDSHGRKRILGYVTGAGFGPESLAALRGALLRNLPDFMVPSEILALDALPLTASGKIDRARLPDPPPRLASAAGAPRSSIEQTLAEAWQRVLGRDHVDPGDNFFDLGGTSLQLIELHAMLETLLPGRLTLVDLFQYPRISLLAARLHDAKPQAAAAPPSRARLAAEASRRAQLARVRAGS